MAAVAVIHSRLAAEHAAVAECVGERARCWVPAAGAVLAVAWDSTALAVAMAAAVPVAVASAVAADLAAAVRPWLAATTGVAIPDVDAVVPGCWPVVVPVVCWAVVETVVAATRNADKALAVAAPAVATDRLAAAWPAMDRLAAVWRATELLAVAWPAMA